MSKELHELLPIVQEKANTLIKLCKAQDIDVLVTSTYRSIEEQNEIYAQGRTKPGAIVTNAKGGQSFHNHRVAFDVVPLVAGKAVWDNKELWEKIGKIGEAVGLEWGGRWKSFVDKSHFQFTQGYTFDDFNNGRVDPAKFALTGKPVEVPVTPSEKPQNAPEQAKPPEVDIPYVTGRFSNITQSTTNIIALLLTVSLVFLTYTKVIEPDVIKNLIYLVFGFKTVRSITSK